MWQGKGWVRGIGRVSTKPNNINNKQRSKDSVARIDWQIVQIAEETHFAIYRSPNSKELSKKMRAHACNTGACTCVYRQRTGTLYFGANAPILIGGISRS